MADGGVMEAIALIEAAEAAAVAAETAAAATAATAAGSTAATAGATAAGSIAAEEAATIAAYEAAGMGAGGTAGATALSAEELAMVQAMDGGAYGGMEGATSLLTDPSAALAQDGTGNAFTSDYEKYKHFAKSGFESLGKGYNKLPKAAQGMIQGQATQGLLGSPAPQAQNRVVAPSGGAGPPQNSNPYAQQQQMPKATPYAPSLLGGEDDAEMKKRLMLLRQMQGGY